MNGNQWGRNLFYKTHGNSSNVSGLYFYFEATVVGMSYTEQTMTLDWRIYTSLASWSSGGRTAAISLTFNGDEIYSETKNRTITAEITEIATGTYEMPYNGYYEQGDSYNGYSFKPELIFTVKSGSSALLETIRCGTDGNYDYPYMVTIQQEPFVIQPFWDSEGNGRYGGLNEQPGNPLAIDAYGHVAYDTGAVSFKVCVPKDLDDSIIKAKFVLPGSATLGNIFEVEIPRTEGVHTLSYSLTNQQRNILNQLIREAAGSSEPLDYYMVEPEIQFMTLGGVSDKSYSPIPLGTNSYTDYNDVTYNRYELKMQISDTCPGVSGTVVDTNAATQALTGNNNILVRYMSNANATVIATPSGGTTITSYAITNNNERYTGQTHNFLKVESKDFIFEATDNRGETGFYNYSAPFVDYVIPTAKVSTSVITGEGAATVKVTGSYYDGSFGLAENELFVYFRYKKQGESDNSFTDWIALSSVTIDATSKTYTATGAVSGLNYMSTYVFQASVADALNTIRGADYIAASKPVFDWSSTDFNFNVPVTIMGNLIGGANNVLWSGNNVMAANGRAALAQPISEQMHGIALVFSNTSGDVSWNIFYIPKGMVSLYNGGGQTFLMAVNAGLSTFGAKYLYISDDEITGHATNQESGVSASNIIFNNANYVLRYVFGV